MSLRKGFLFVGLIAMTAFFGCGKPRLFGKEMELEPIYVRFKTGPELTFKAAKESLAFNGYNLMKEDPKQGVLETHWQPTTSNSHCVIVFERKDCGTVGAYHKLVLKIRPDGKESKVEIYSIAKTFISNLVSSGSEEERILKKMGDFTRKHDIQVTNVGVQ